MVYRSNLKFHIYFILYFSLLPNVDAQCGEILTAPRGTFNTPNFPDPFHVPISCKWIIDATDTATPNTSIVVYLTEVFVVEGLTFDEYDAYGMGYNIVGNRIHTVLETNVAKTKWVQTQKNIMVVTFELQNNENSYLRVLDNFLNENGFNITYEITTDPVREDACSASACGFTGVCVDEIERFTCNCVDGYEGPSCSDGPASLCKVDGVPYCQNGGTCRHVGSSFVKCDCREGYTGSRCEKLAIAASTDVCASGLYPESCGCTTPADETPDGVDFATTLRILQPPNFTKDQLRRILKNQLTNAKVSTNISQIRVKELSFHDWGAQATVHFHDMKKDKKRLQTLVESWSNASRIGGLALVKPILPLNGTYPVMISIHSNHVGRVPEGEFVVLTCVTLAQPGTTYRWYKDGAPVLSSQISRNDKWFRIVPDDTIKDQMTSIMGIEKVSILDQGTFVCEAVDPLGNRKCIAKTVEVRQRPVVKMYPRVISVEKGDSFRVKCLSEIEEKGDTNYTYSWTKNRELLPIRTDKEEYFILYPSGSILNVRNVQAPSLYSCLVQDQSASTEIGIEVHVYDRSIHTCPSDTNTTIPWTETYPDTESLQACPRGFTGIASRECLKFDATAPKWMTPDFSRCTADALTKTYKYFELLKLGYGFRNELEILEGFQNYLRGRLSLLPNEGIKILQLMHEVIYHVENNANSKLPMQNITHVALDTVSRTLGFSNAFVGSKQIEALQTFVREKVSYADLLLKGQDIYHEAFPMLDVTIFHGTKLNLEFTVPPDDICCSYPSWYSVMVEFKPSPIQKNRCRAIGVVVYKDLTAFLPEHEDYIRRMDGSKAEYKIISKITAIWVVDLRLIDTLANLFSITFFHPPPDKPSVSCVWASNAARGQDWFTSSCRTERVNATVTKCWCRELGTYAVIATDMPPVEEIMSTIMENVFLFFALIISLITSVMLFIILSVNWLMKQGGINYLKLQYCMALSCTNGAFVVAHADLLGKDCQHILTTSLSISLLVAVSSQVGQCLIVFTEFVENYNKHNISGLIKTIVAVCVGVPLIAVFANHLALGTLEPHRSNSTWFENGTLSMNIFSSVLLLLTILYVVLYLVVMELFAQIVRNEEKEPPLVIKRKKLLRRSLFLFSTTLVLIFSSVVYKNVTEPIWAYVFGFSDLFLVFSAFFCYTSMSEAPNMMDTIWEPGPRTCISRRKDTSFNDTHSNSDPKPPTARLSDLQNIPNESNQKESNEDVKEYNYSPDVVATSVHVELDLVPPIEQEKQPEIPLCNPIPDTRCDSFKPFFATLENIENTSKLIERLEPEGVEVVDEGGDVAKPDEAGIDDTLDGMLVKISHDLDYLLNRKGTFARSVSNDDLVRPEGTEPVTLKV